MSATFILIPLRAPIAFFALARGRSIVIERATEVDFSEECDGAGVPGRWECPLAGFLAVGEKWVFKPKIPGTGMGVVGRLCREPTSL